MPRVTHLEIHQAEFSFSAGHFTIFSATEREALHGHNYNVSIKFHFTITHNGLAFDYRHYKKKINELCTSIDRHFLLPAHSPYLALEEQADYWIAIFNQKKIPFLKEDVIILPLVNITIEELAYWFLEKIRESDTEFSAHGIHGIELKVYNGPGQSASAQWGDLS